jgi:histidinol-phosphate aminotransferase
MDLSALANARVVRRSNHEPAHPYPFAETELLREVVADHLGVAPTNIVVGAGSDALIQAVLRALVPPQGLVGVVSPGYDLLTALPRALGLKVQPLPDDVDSWQRHPVDALLLASPDYPSGRTLGLDTALALRSRGPVLIDQAYLEYVYGAGPERLEPWLHDDVVLLRTCSKFRGHPDLRVGWAVTTEATARRVAAHLLPFPCSSAALVTARDLVCASAAPARGGPASSGPAGQVRAARRLAAALGDRGHLVPSDSRLPWVWLPDCDADVLDVVDELGLGDDVRVAYVIGSGVVLKT